MTWTLKRNCSASPRLLVTCFLSAIAVSLLFGLAFAAMGLWLVLPFVGIELLALAAAFAVTVLHATDFERIELADGRLSVERADGRRRQRWSAPSAWARVEQVDDAAGLRATPRVLLASGGHRIEVGRLVPDEARRRLASQLRAALAQR